MKKANQNVTTPVGTLQYPALIEPDTRFNPDGLFKTNIVIPAGDSADEFEEALTAAKKSAIDLFAKESGGKKVKIAAAAPFERDENNNLVVKAKLPARVETKSGKSWTQRPALFDSRGQKIPTDNLRIGSGTRARVALEIAPYNVPATGAGISLRLRGVQIIELREPSGGRAEDFGFGAEEIGFVQESFDNFEDDPKPIRAGTDKKVKAQDF
jgi:hypothetical protein